MTVGLCPSFEPRIAVTFEGDGCVEGLLAALEEPQERARIHSLEGVLADLEALEAVLLVAKAQKARLRLEIA